jgi:hypothetical protein
VLAGQQALREKPVYRVLRELPVLRELQVQLEIPDQTVLLDRKELLVLQELPALKGRPVPQASRGQLVRKERRAQRGHREQQDR